MENNTPTQVSLNERIFEILKENTSMECGDDYKFEITNINEAANAIERLVLQEKIDLLKNIRLVNGGIYVGNKSVGELALEVNNNLKELL